MNNNSNMQHICHTIEEISTYKDALLESKTYENNICYVLGFLSDVEDLLVFIGNMRFDSSLTDSQIQLEEQIFDEWMALYNIASVILTKRTYSEGHKKKINEYTESTLAKLKEFESTIQDKAKYRK